MLSRNIEMLEQMANVKLECRAGISGWYKIQHNIKKNCECRDGMVNWLNVQKDIQKLRMTSWNVEPAQN